MLLKVLERQRVNNQPAELIYITRYYIGSSPNLSSIICVSTSNTVYSLLVDLVFPNLLYNFDTKWLVLYLTFITGSTLLDDLFFFNLMCTFVNGLFEYFFVFIRCGHGSLLDTLVFAGLFAVKCFHIGLLFSFASSFTPFMLCLMASFHLVSHLFSCWFVSSSLEWSDSSYYIFSSSSGSTISLIVYRCVIFFDDKSYSATILWYILPPNTGVLRSMHLSVHISNMIGTIAWKNACNSSLFCFCFLLVFVCFILFLSLSFLLSFYSVILDWIY